jgi:hypothetical protein
VHDLTFDKEMVEFVSNGALAHTGTTADQQECCGLVNPHVAQPSFTVLKYVATQTRGAFQRIQTSLVTSEVGSSR